MGKMHIPLVDKDGVSLGEAMLGDQFGGSMTIAFNTITTVVDVMNAFNNGDITALVLDVQERPRD